MKEYSRDIAISHASFYYLTNGVQLPFSSAFRFWFQIIFSDNFSVVCAGPHTTYYVRRKKSSFLQVYFYT